MRRTLPGSLVRQALCLLVLSAGPLSAQALQPRASGRASTEVSLDKPREEGQTVPPPLKLRVDYGQPHARGRAVEGALMADLDTIWRLGANEATSLTTDVDLVLGNLTVPKGEYTLYTRTSRTGEWMLIVSKKTRQWGTDYDSAMDLGRVPLRSRPLATPIESLSIWLIPAAERAPNGELRFAWGTREFTVNWSVKSP